MDCSLGIAAILTLLFLGVIFFCAFRFLKKKRQNQKAEKNKKIAEDEKILIEEAEDIDILEDPIEVGFFFNLMLIKHCIDCHLFPVSVPRFTKHYYAEFALQLSTFCHVAGNCVSICLNLFYARSFAILLQTSIQNPTILAHESSIKVKHL